MFLTPGRNKSISATKDSVGLVALLAVSALFFAGISPALAVSKETQKPSVQSETPLSADPEMIPLPPIEAPDWLPPAEPLLADELSTPLPENPEMKTLPSHEAPMPPDAKVIDPPEAPEQP
jgi:hypothetical protein